VSRQGHDGACAVANEVDALEGVGHDGALHKVIWRRNALERFQPFQRSLAALGLVRNHPVGVVQESVSVPQAGIEAGKAAPGEFRV
jgi:hypothetical protein